MYDALVINCTMDVIRLDASFKDLFYSNTRTVITHITLEVDGVECKVHSAIRTSSHHLTSTHQYSRCTSRTISRHHTLDCCVPLKIVREVGITVGKVACLAGCSATSFQAFISEESSMYTFRSSRMNVI